MIVADSSFVVDFLLSGDVALGDETMIAPDLLVYEVANAILVREKMLRITDTGQKYVAALFRAMDSSFIETVDLSESLMNEAYEIASRHRAAIYDCTFVALCLRSGLPLATKDASQRKIYEQEKERQLTRTKDGGREQ